MARRAGRAYRSRRFKTFLLSRPYLLGVANWTAPCRAHECCCSKMLGSANKRRNRVFGWAGRSKAATKAFHWSAFNEKRRLSASISSASAQALRMMKSVRLSPRSCAPRRINSSCCAEVRRFRRRDRGAFKAEGITSSLYRHCTPFWGI
jgi:hypothetical protein